MKTIAVCGFFGDKKVNREEFIAQWVGHVGELRVPMGWARWQASRPNGLGTLASFEAQWVGHVGELRGLSFNQDFAEKIENFEIDVRREAGREFDRLYNQQHPA